VEKPVRAWEIEDAANAQGSPLQPGDAVLVYSGRPAFFAANPSAVPGVAPSPGLHVDTAKYLKDKDAAILGWDMMDSTPSGYSVFPGLSVHVLTIVMAGMPLLDNALLEPLAEACKEENRWEFLLTINTLNVRGGTGSPVNPVAIF
jgi:kynurenine formamidase